MRHIGNGRMIHQKGSELAVYRSLIAIEAKKAGCKPIEGPIKIKIGFGFKRPKTVKRDYPTTPPDTDKLIRAVLDSLTDVAYNDDSQVIEITAKKFYSENYVVDIEITDGFDVLDCS
jgi:crossover junction endodeoxyribonuclease RusA